MPPVHFIGFGSQPSYLCARARVLRLVGRFGLVFTLFSCALLVARPANATYPNGYSQRRTITIPAQTTNTSTLSNFPIVISGTFTYLSTVTASGGVVTSTSGYDIIFSTNSSGSPLLNWETEKYVGATGEVQLWVKMPTISSSTAQTLYMYYGNSSVTVFQSTATGTWDGNFGGVWHLKNTTTLSATDSTSNGNAGSVTSVSAAQGKIDGAGSFGGTPSQIDVGSNSSVQPTSAGTFSIWGYWTALTNSPALISNHNELAGSDGAGLYSDSGGNVTLELCNNSGGRTTITGGGVSASTWV